MAARKGKAPPRTPAGLVTQRELARQFRLSVQQIANLDAKGLPHVLRGERKYYELTEAWRWYTDFKAKAARRSGDEEGGEDSAKRRKLEAEARKVELDVAEREGELVPIDYAVDQLRRICDRLRSQLVVLPGKLAPVMVGAKTYQDAQQRLEAGISEALAALSAIGEDPELDDDDSPPRAGRAPATAGGDTGGKGKVARGARSDRTRGTSAAA